MKGSEASTVIKNGMACARCGFSNPTGVSRCLSCGAPLELPGDRVPLWRGRAPALLGTVIAAEPPSLEPVDPSLRTIVGKPILTMAVFLLAAYALLTLLSPIGLLLLFLFGVGLLRLLRPWNVLALLLFYRSRGRRAENLVPVQYFRVRDSAGQEHVVRRKGHLLSGHIMPGDDLALWGRWRRGVLHMQHGLNLRTHAHLVPWPRSLALFWLSQLLGGLRALLRGS